MEAGGDPAERREHELPGKGWGIELLQHAAETRSRMQASYRSPFPEIDRIAEILFALRGSEYSYPLLRSLRTLYSLAIPLFNRFDSYEGPLC